MKGAMRLEGPLDSHSRGSPPRDAVSIGKDRGSQLSLYYSLQKKKIFIVNVVPSSSLQGRDIVTGGRK
jgi:hypothetical protein